ncbi:stellacyanin-like [Pyrus ussuriensis x Pyrus communis]|uniref:Stellacyanin-like n=1 Tax=Pyrus ussuriensis x Pyrus communis TaxID=2448454 RepID=A0A5N5H3U3_9ROSA|nr:stellacyanin-like [Pyrus ussuriensis x Pyrus communis]
MASSHLFILVTLAIVAPCILVTDFVVGDDKAQGKQFYVGEKLDFKYPKGVHNVHKVNGTGFQQSAAPLDSVPLTSGNDVVTLATPGRKWYICGVGQHCKAGNQKFLITVMPSSTPSPSPSYTASSPSTSIPYTSAATGIAGTRYGWRMTVVFGFLALLTA